ncbi:phosphofructokinase [Stenotrophomonas phage Philippe]|uniref:DUF6378 domain-containing protein n=1 Tax=Stenotrophomonas phage Philippe TaxID=2859655 RepID=A0AAE8BLQ1_9CAUD|nr:phosphofructokinase [Stenotrophomonas phage Philippe]QYW02263.1 hypothetical protein CPT_Philippe_070 [Stenotrophomonas phage Philippe]
MSELPERRDGESAEEFRVRCAIHEKTVKMDQIISAAQLPEYIHASELIKEAADTLGTRAAERDVEEERSMARVVAIFNARHGTNMTEAEGWSFMICLKLGRSVTGRFRKDDYIDAAAYAVLEGECRSKGAKS